MRIISKKIVVYVIGLFLLSLGVSFSIQANLGVSPVSSLAYAFTLVGGLSIGLTTILANILFIVIQIILSKRIELREFAVQLLVVLLFGFFMDTTLYIVQLFSAPLTLFGNLVFLALSFFIISFGLLAYFSAGLPLMPYDALTYVIGDRFKLKFSTAKITSDLLNVGVAGLIGIIFTQSLGAIGVGTVLAAYFIGKILGPLLHHFEPILHKWMNKKNINTK